MREPSDHRFIRAFDCSFAWFEGECRHLKVVKAVLKAEKVADGALVLWWSVVGGWKEGVSQARGSIDMNDGIFRRYIFELLVSFDI